MTAPAVPNLNNQQPTEPSRIARGVALGASGLRHWAGYISEEFLPELRGLRGYRVYDEMRQNEPMLAALMLSIESIIQSVEWTTIAEDDAQGADVAAKAFVDMAFERLDRPLSDIMSDICTMFPFGYAPMEVTYKYVDGRVWWASWDLRGQDSTFRWLFDAQGHPTVYIQRPAPTYEEIAIPLDKMLLFRTRTEKDNPEGRSIFRAAYKPYFYKKIIEEIEAMGAERDLLGIPVINVPFGATEEEVKDATKLVERIKVDEQAGIVLTAIGPTPEERYTFSLVTGQGSATKISFTGQLIERYTAEMALSALVTFLHVGGRIPPKEQTYVLDNAPDMFQMAIKNWLGRIADVINYTAIPRLLAMNGMTGKARIQHGRITQINLQTITNFLVALVQNSLLTPDRMLEQFLRKEAELPPLSSSERTAADAAPAAKGAPASGSLGAQPGTSQAPDNRNQFTGYAARAAAQTVQAVGGESRPGNPAVPPAPPAARAMSDNDAWEDMAHMALADMIGGFWDD